MSKRSVNGLLDTDELEERDPDRSSRTKQRRRITNSIDGLSDEVLIYVFGWLDKRDLAICQAVSQRWACLSVDNQLWKGLADERFLRRRRDFLTKVRMERPNDPSYARVGDDVTESENWKGLYKTRQNWEEGRYRRTATVLPTHITSHLKKEIPEPLIVYHADLVFTVEYGSELKSWRITDGFLDCVAASSVFGKLVDDSREDYPTAMAISDSPTPDRGVHIILGFASAQMAVLRLVHHEDGGYQVEDRLLLNDQYISRNGGIVTVHEISHIAFTYPYVGVLFESRVFRSYRVQGDEVHRQGRCELEAYSLPGPITMDIRFEDGLPVATVLYPCRHLSGRWSLTVQEIFLDGVTKPMGRLYGREGSIGSGWSIEDNPLAPSYISYRHPYAVTAHKDNTLMLYRVYPADGGYFVKDTKLFGHTSGVLSCAIDRRSRAVSVARSGEIRVWDLYAEYGGKDLVLEGHESIEDGEENVAVLGIDDDKIVISRREMPGAPRQTQILSGADEFVFEGGDPSHQARDCPKRGNPVCYNCNQEGHISRECQEPQKEKSCYRCGETGHLSRECPTAGPQQSFGGQGQGFGASAPGAECYKCGKVGHIARNCTLNEYGQQQQQGGFGGFGAPRGQTCYTCGGFGHMARDCTQGQKCYNCGGFGHVSRDCQQPQQQKSCYRCNQPGHIARECPNEQAPAA
ncbi:hypothetical protein YB2330_002062 [Saitoella coloradoensis]